MMTTTAPVEVITVGETMGCLVLHGHRDTGTVSFIGAESNVAIGLALLGHRTRWVSRLGDDQLGDHIAERLREYGVEPAVARDPARQTGLAVKELRDGRTTVRYYRTDSAASAMSVRDIPPFGEAGWLHLSGITSALSSSCAALVPELMRRAREQRVRVSFDVNLRPVLWDSLSRAREQLREQCGGADLVFIGEDESRLLGLGETVEEFRERVRLRPDAVVVFKRGAQGAQALVAGTVHASDAAPAEVVDLTGAGDAFAAGFLSGQLRELSPRACLRLGGSLAAQVIGIDRDFVPPPDPGRLAEILSVLDEETIPTRNGSS